MVRNMKGFTMVELMIVIAIIGVLAVSLIPTLTGVQAKWRDTARIASITNAGTSITVYATDASSYPWSSNGCLSSATGTIGAVTYTQGASTVVTNTVEWFFANKKAPVDPQWSSAPTNTACSTKWSFGYQAGKAVSNYDAGILSTGVESSSRGNQTIASTYSTGWTATITLATSGTGYVRVVTAN